MRIIVVDDERMALESLVESIQEVTSDSQIVQFTNPESAVAFVQENPCDVAFLDIQMFRLNGLEMARMIKQIRPQINIIFTTGYSAYLLDAFRMHASGYLMKPITSEDVRKELEALRYPIAMTVNKRVRFRCFGNFEVFVDGRPMSFKYEKSRECLAYLVDRAGAMCTTKEIMAAIFGDGDHSSYMRNIRKNLLDTLKEFRCQEILLNEWGKMGIDMSQVECDYYRWLEGNVDGINSYRGEYMTNYSWAEMTNANLYNNN